MWLSRTLEESQVTRHNLITLIVLQNLVLLACFIAWIVMHTRSWQRRRSHSKHTFLRPTTQPLTDPITIWVTKVVTVKTEVRSLLNFFTGGPLAVNDVYMYSGVNVRFRVSGDGHAP